MARAAWRAVGPRRRHVVRVVGEAVAAAPRRRSAPRARAPGSAPPAPAPPRPRAITKPSRPASNGRLACAGSSLRVDMARMMAKAPKQSGASGASAPPASMTSASPRTMARNAVADGDGARGAAHPVGGVGAGAAELDGDVAAGRAGEHGERERRIHRRAAPRSGTRGSCRSPCATPPSAVPIIAPTRSGSSRGEVELARRPAPCRVAAMVNCE